MNGWEGIAGDSPKLTAEVNSGAANLVNSGAANLGNSGAANLVNSGAVQIGMMVISKNCCSLS
jgi:hypothetical protein